MKVWINAKTKRMVAYESDFPNGAPGLVLIEQGEPPRAAAIVEPVAEPSAADSDLPPDAGSQEREALIVQFTERYGRAPHPAMKTEKLVAKLAEPE